MNPFLLHPRDLRNHWRDFRRNLLALGSDSNQLSAVVRYWNMAPISNRYLDYHDCSTWPDPWTLIDNKDFDDSSINLGMFYTLLLADGNNWPSTRIKLAMIRNDSISKECLVCLVDDCWLLGYDIAGLINMHDESGIRVIQYYRYDNDRRRVVEVPTHAAVPQVSVA